MRKVFYALSGQCKSRSAFVFKSSDYYLSLSSIYMYELYIACLKTLYIDTYIYIDGQKLLLPVIYISCHLKINFLILSGPSLSTW